MACKNICIKYIAKKPVKGTRYGVGQKRCQTCEKFLWWDEPTCPCCHYKLRNKSRLHSATRDRLYAQKRIK